MNTEDKDNPERISDNVVFNNVVFDNVVYDNVVCGNIITEHDFPYDESYLVEPEVPIKKTSSDGILSEINSIALFMMEDEVLTYQEAREKAIEEISEERNWEEEALHTEMQEYEEELEMDLDDDKLSNITLRKSNRVKSSMRKFKDN